ncbi:hypothetical protein RhiirA4_473456 [Rhizophagus irregularis]|uniref:FAR1 domain-containing protein n=1 Tax=Rhizophagus irregularis TaxID=588596 RepID=A0A2I1H6R2_9GLOM|nr:hypothetical protein RhiirA4_473456 [Rhizophagus irregularis]
MINNIEQENVRCDKQYNASPSTRTNKDFRNWIHIFGLKEEFNYKIKTSKAIQGVIRRVTYKCTKSGSHISQAMSDLIKQCNTYSQQILCLWKLNVVCSKTSDIVRINSFNNIHNHLLILMIQEMAPRFQKLTKKMLADVKKYVIQGWMDSTSIYILLKHNYPN